VHHVYVLPIQIREAGMRKTGAQSANSIDCTGIEDGSAPHASAVPGVAIASSGTVWKGVEEAQVGLHCMCWVRRSIPSSAVGRHNYLQQLT
jgi:hypothetical protein